ncbi:hypothetical protein EJB05_03988 [Eragrostis curvula]|uniref:Cysteine-rich transmembrane domain-containing protein n=1 Tax=Eragrostis curvula TaxID=38414 RepID=A0A5J9W990_9POAL|nr:hypothetical protein EJB05_03988 [Eragrostis curvula]
MSADAPPPPSSSSIKRAPGRERQHLLHCSLPTCSTRHLSRPFLLLVSPASFIRSPKSLSRVESQKKRKKMSDPKYGYPYPAQGYYQGPYQGPPVMAPPQYAAPPPRRQPGFLEGCLAALCCCCLVDECCCDPSIIFVS